MLAAGQLEHEVKTVGLLVAVVLQCTIFWIPFSSISGGPQPLILETSRTVQHGRVERGIVT